MIHGPKIASYHNSAAWRVQSKAFGMEQQPCCERPAHNRLLEEGSTLFANTIHWWMKEIKGKLFGPTIVRNQQKG